MKLRKCSCGKRPEYVSDEDASDDEGYCYYICPHNCGEGPAWGATRRIAAVAWNTMRAFNEAPIETNENE